VKGTHCEVCILSIKSIYFHQHLVIRHPQYVLIPHSERPNLTHMQCHYVLSLEHEINK